MWTHIVQICVVYRSPVYQSYDFGWGPTCPFSRLQGYGIKRHLRQQLRKRLLLSSNLTALSIPLHRPTAVPLRSCPLPSPFSGEVECGMQSGTHRAYEPCTCSSASSCWLTTKWHDQTNSWRLAESSPPNTQWDQCRKEERRIVLGLRLPGDGVPVQSAV